MSSWRREVDSLARENYRRDYKMNNSSGRIFGGAWKLACLIVCVALFAACKSSGGGNNSNSEQPSYQTARTLPPLDVPPDLSQFPPSGEYVLPATEDRQDVAGAQATGNLPPVSEEIQEASPGFDQPSSGGAAFGDDGSAEGYDEGLGALSGIGEPDATEEVVEFDPQDMTVNLQESEEGGPYLVVTAPFHIIWQQLALGLDREQVSILDRDRTNGRFYIDCSTIEEPLEDGKKKRKGWFFGFGKERGETEICLLNVVMEGGAQGDIVGENSATKGDIFLTTDEGDSVDEELASQFLERIQRHFG
jgi:uncharacterized lipoprotein